MEMEVSELAVSSPVLHNAVSGSAVDFLICANDLPCDAGDLKYIVVGQIQDRIHMHLRDNKHMPFVSGVDIKESDGLLRL